MHARNQWIVPVLANVTNAQALSDILGISPKLLESVLQNKSKLYVHIARKKKDGSTRKIRAPKEELKKVQRSILDTLLIKISLPSCAYGFASGRGIVENAKLHAGEGYTATLDIENFFPSVLEQRVRGLFQKMGAAPVVAQILSNLTTLDRQLPQGAPSSPYLAALALNELDARVVGLCARNRLTYSRYFDDIAISGNKRALEVVPTIIEIVKSSGFKVNERKTCMYSPNDTKLITGITVEHGKLSVSNVGEIVDYIGALKLRGLRALRGDDPFKERLSLQGRLAFLSSVDPVVGQRLKSEYSKVIW